MRRFLPLLLLGLSIPTSAQQLTDLPIAKPARSLKEVMIEVLGDPKVQVALKITAPQLQLQNIRISKVAMRLAFDSARNALGGSEEVGANADFFNLGSTLSPGATLFPFLSEGQLAKLRRMAIRDLPLNALGTNEMAFALELTAAQRAKIDAIRTGYYRSLLNSDRASIRSLKAAGQKISTKLAKFASEEDAEVTAERIAAVQPVILEMFAAFENSIRLSAKEKFPAPPDPLKLLTTTQRRRFRELSKV